VQDQENMPQGSDGWSDFLDETKAVVQNSGVDAAAVGEFAVGLHGTVEGGAGLAIGDDGEATERKFVPDLFQRRQDRAIKSHVDQGKSDVAVKFVAFDIGFYTEGALAVVATEGVLEPFDPVTAEAAEVAGIFATLLDFESAVFGSEAVESVQTIVVLIDPGGLQVLIEENGRVAVGATQFEDIAGDVASLVEALDKEGEVLGCVVVPVAVKSEAAERRVLQQRAHANGCHGFGIAKHRAPHRRCLRRVSIKSVVLKTVVPVKRMAKGPGA